MTTTPETVTQRHILVHATLVGLTPLIPLPWLDEVVKEHLQRRLVRTLANAHGLDIGPADVKVLADDPPSSWVKGAVASAALWPVRAVLRKTFMVLQGKRIVDLASECYHRGFLADHAFRGRWCAPVGPRGAPEIRAAIDAVCREMPTRPVEEALRVGFSEARVAVVDAAGVVQRTFGGLVGATPDEVTGAVDRVSVESPAVLGITERIRRAVSEVPAEHFEEVRRRLDQKLGERRWI